MGKMIWWKVVFVALVVASLSIGGCSAFVPPTSSASPTPPVSTTYAPAPLVDLRIVGAHIMAGSHSIQLQGVIADVNQYGCVLDKRSTTMASFGAMRDKWHTNSVKILVDPDEWAGIRTGPGCGPAAYAAYPAALEAAIARAEQAGFYVMLTMANFRPREQHLLDASASWTTLKTTGDLSTQYRSDRHILMEIYSEPHDITYQVWRDGDAQSGWIGMQQLVDTINANAPQMPVFANAPNWGGDPGLVVSSGYGLHGRNLGYTAHIYDGGQNANLAHWSADWESLAQQVPVIAAEFGDIRVCDGSWLNKLMPVMAARIAGWFAWVWDNSKDDCHRPAVISSAADSFVTGQPSAYGMPIWRFYTRPR